MTLMDLFLFLQPLSIGKLGYASSCILVGVGNMRFQGRPWARKIFSFLSFFLFFLSAKDD